MMDQANVYREKVTDCEEVILENLTAAGMSALSKALPDYTRLKRLTLRSFDCREDDAFAFAEA